MIMMSSKLSLRGVTSPRVVCVGVTSPRVVCVGMTSYSVCQINVLNSVNSEWSS